MPRVDRSGPRRALWGVILLALAHAAFSLATRPPPARLRLQPAAEGPIRTLAIQFHRAEAGRFLPVFRAILDALDPGVSVVAVVGDAEDARILEGALGRDLEVRAVGRPITSWLRDRLAVLADPSGAAPPVLLAPVRPALGGAARRNDWPVPWDLAAAVGARARRAAWTFDGGDLVADSERAWVATPLFRRNPDREPAALLADLEADLGRPVTWIGAGGEAVPDHHVGMFLTPLGDGRVVVGDPDLAASVLGGRPAALDLAGRPFAVDLSPERAARFRAVARAVEEAGAEAIPMPLVPGEQPYAWISYNNVLAETRGGRLHVVLPVYGHAALDAAATAAWEALGAEVDPVDVRDLFELGGSVRCLTAVLERGPPGPVGGRGSAVAGRAARRRRGPGPGE